MPTAPTVTTVYRTPCPPPEPPFRWGLFAYDLARMLGTLAACGALTAVGCYSLARPDGCAPGSTRCSPSGVPQTCSPGQRWTAAPLALPCVERVTVTGERAGLVCRETRSVYAALGGAGRVVWACAPMVDADGGADADGGL